VEYMNWAPADLFVELPKCENGWFRIPDRPGHGMALTPDAVKKYGKETP
jgi:L-alanine-DL-glutamate epimerase-like enolase superfamily enzyme